MTPKNSIFLLLLNVLLCTSSFGQEKDDLKKLMPRKFIEKLELSVGGNLTIPNGKDQVAGVYPNVNPNIQSNYYTDWGYRLTLGGTHSFGKAIYLMLQLGYSKRAYINAWYVHNINHDFESQNFYGIKYFFSSLRLDVPINRKKSFFAYSGASVGRVDYVMYENKTYVNASITSSYKRRVNQPNSISMSPYSFDVIAGVRYDFALNTTKGFSISMQYDYAINDLIHTSQPYLLVRTSTLNLSISFFVTRQPNFKYSNHENK